MTTQLDTSPVTRSLAQRQWDRLPLLVRAVLSGLVVFQVIQGVCVTLLVVNLTLTPSVPWHIPLALGWLWLSTRYFGGWGRPESTQASRRRLLRARPLTATEWKWALAATFGLLVFMMAFVNVIYRIVEVPDNAVMDLSELPWWTLYPTILMFSLTAGVSEEAGFRGYLQGPLEERYGPWAAVSITALLFWAAHLNHADAVPRIWVLVFYSVCLSGLTMAARSIQPAIMAHFLIDAFAFTTVIGEIGPDFFHQPAFISETGIDGAFIAACLLTPVLGGVYLLLLRRIRSEADEVTGLSSDSEGAGRGRPSNRRPGN